MPGQAGEALLQVRSRVVGHLGHQLLFLDDADVFQRRRAGHGVARIGKAVREFAALLDQDLGHPVAHQHPAQRHIARGDALGKGDQVGLDAEQLGAEPAPQAAETADDFIGDEQDAVLVADALDFRPIRRWGDDDAARALHRFADEGGHLVGADFQDLVFQPAGRLQAEGFRRQAVARFQVVGLADMRDARYRQAALRMHAIHAAQRRPRHRAAVIRVVAADDGMALLVAEDIPVAAHHAQIRVVAFRSGTGEEHVLELRRRYLRQLGRQLRGRHVGRAKEAVIEGQRLHLFVHGLRDRRAAIAHIHAPQARHAVDDLLALAIPQVDAVAAHHHPGALACQVLEIGERMQVVGRVHFLDGGRVIHLRRRVFLRHGGYKCGARRQRIVGCAHACSF